MHFDHRHFAGHQCVANRYRGVGPGCRVNHDASATGAGAVDPVEQFAFVVSLAEFDFQPEFFRASPTQGGDVGQGFMAVGGGLAGAEQVEIGAVEHQHDGRHFGVSPQLLLVVEIKCTGWLIWSIDGGGSVRLSNRKSARGRVFGGRRPPLPRAWGRSHAQETGYRRVNNTPDSIWCVHGNWSNIAHWVIRCVSCSCAMFAANVSGLQEMYRMLSKRRVSSQVSGSMPARGGSTNTLPNS